MKMPVCFTILTSAALIVNACGGGTPTPSAEEVMVVVYTSVAMTFNVQPDAVEVQSTPGAEPSVPPALSSPTETRTAFPASTVAAYAIASTCYGSAYVSDVTIPDGTILAPGEAFTKTWQFQNTGTCAWTDNFSITFTGGNDMGGVTTSIDQYTFPGDTSKASVDLFAPETDGTYAGYWQLADEHGILFGEVVYVEIVVSDDSAILTPTSTTKNTAFPSPTVTLTTASVESTPTPTLTGAPFPIVTDISTAEVTITCGATGD